MTIKKGSQIVNSTKRIIKENKRSTNPLLRFGINFLYLMKNRLSTTKRICVDQNFRSIFLLTLFNSKSVHQTTSLTYMDRYPMIFNAAKDYFEGKSEIRILSYGCSTGEEVLTLRKYFPHAHIVGAEINKHSLKHCQTLPVDDQITFIYSNTKQIQKHGPYDAIFCMAVLQRKPHEVTLKGITDLKSIYPFEKFEQQIEEFDGLLNQNGLLVLHYTQYDLQETMMAKKYVPLGDYNQNDYVSPVFDRNSQIKEDSTNQNTVFIKQFE